MSVDSKVWLASEVNFSLTEIPQRPEASKVLMATPDWFDVVDIKNVHMQGQKGRVDQKLAHWQWEKLRTIYRQLKEKGIIDEVAAVPGAEGCEDMVFSANQSFPWITANGEKVVIMSKMRHDSRKREVPFFADYYRKQGYRLIELQQTEMFEGMGDAIPQPGKRLIYGGYGHRTALSAYEEISSLLQVPVVALRLVNEKFYHLDTCFIPVDDKTVLLYPGAFQNEDLQGLKRLFEEVMEIPEEEAEKNFALNAHLISSSKGKAAVLQQGSPVMVNALKAKGFKIFETDTSEYIKSGGSVFCMKMMHY